MDVEDIKEILSQPERSVLANARLSGKLIRYAKENHPEYCLSCPGTLSRIYKLLQNNNTMATKKECQYQFKKIPGRGGSTYAVRPANNNVLYSNDNLTDAIAEKLMATHGQFIEKKPKQKVKDVVDNKPLAPTIDHNKGVPKAAQVDKQPETPQPKVTPKKKASK